MFRSTFVFICVCVCISHAAYPPVTTLPTPTPGPYVSPSPYSAPAPAQVVSLPQKGEAQAAASSNAAEAKATAAKIDITNWDAIDKYGLETGVPLLAKKYGPLTNLYAAALPPRGFVAQIDPAFVKDSYGNIKYIGSTSIGAMAF